VSGAEGISPSPVSAEPEGASRWPASSAVLALVVALVATFVASGLIVALYLAAGVDDPDNSASFDFVAIGAQSIAFVAVALAVTARFTPPSARLYGFRRFKASALAWALLGLVVYFILSAIYIAFANPPQDDLPQELGADKSTTLAIVTGVFVIGVAPFVEEFFFRGFLYRAFRNRIGVIGAALASALTWSAIHFKPEFLVPLAILGVVLALLFEKTGSLWPCIMVHALNNALAFAVSI
jgi:uncharacterized protein